MNFWIVMWTPELRAVIERIKALPRPKFATHLFCKKNGKPFIDHEMNITGFGNMWRAAMKLTLKETD